MKETSLSYLMSNAKTLRRKNHCDIHGSGDGYNCRSYTKIPLKIGWKGDRIHLGICKELLLDNQTSEQRRESELQRSFQKMYISRPTITE
jgi:hypothetical protein